MGFRDFICSPFGAWRYSRSKHHDTKGTANVVYGGARFNLEEWVSNQKSTYGSREGIAERLEWRASHFNTELLGLSGELLDELIYKHPRMIPERFWGGDLGWRSTKRKKQWEELLTRNGIIAPRVNQGLLVRFFINSSDWVPHPYTPPHWAMSDYRVFSEYIAPSEEAFKLCLQWRTENCFSLTNRLANRLNRFPVQISAGYLYNGQTDYAELAFYLLDSGTAVLRVKTLWKGETKLYQLVKGIFPHACREYSPSWLLGQRIDVFIPLLQVALEYHGKQHYEPVEYFGGKKGFLMTKERDQRKAQACKEARVTFIEWKYTEPITESNLIKKLKAHGIEMPES